MTTISVPLPVALVTFVNDMVRQGKAANKADVVRRALTKMAEEEAVNAVLRSEQEAKEGKIFSGDLRELMKKLA